MTVRHTVQALAGLEETLGYIARDQPAAAREMGQRIRGAIAGLASFPEVGRQGRVPGTWEVAVAPFVVAYRVNGGQVDILAIPHGARMWPSSFGD